jgi:hypothetical protein
MIASYLTDTVDIITRVVDTWGHATESTQLGVAARVEDKNQVVRDQNGKEVASTTHVMLATGTVVGYQSYLRIKTRCGQAAELPQKEWPVKSLAKGHGFAVLDWEVWL